MTIEIRQTPVLLLVGLVVGGVASVVAAAILDAVGALVLAAPLLLSAVRVGARTSRRPAAVSLEGGSGVATLRLTHRALKGDLICEASSVHSILVGDPLARSWPLISVDDEWVRTSTPGDGGKYVRYLVTPSWRRGDVLIVFSPALPTVAQGSQGHGVRQQAVGSEIRGVLIRSVDHSRAIELLARSELAGRVVSELPLDVPSYLYQGHPFVVLPQSA